jgi:hypothetical protein
MTKSLQHELHETIHTSNACGEPAGDGGARTARGAIVGRHQTTTKVDHAILPRLWHAATAWRGRPAEIIARSMTMPRVPVTQPQRPPLELPDSNFIAMAAAEVYTKVAEEAPKDQTDVPGNRPSR